MTRGVAMPRCGRCGHVHFPARALCPRCHHSGFDTILVDRGVVEECTRTDRAVIASVRTSAGPVVVVALRTPHAPGTEVTLGTGPCAPAHLPGPDETEQSK